MVLIYLLSRRSTGSSASAGDEIAKFNAADPSAVSLRDGDSSLPTSLPQRRPSLNLVVADIRDST
ncbi:unnamed protein product [Mesocestoides corti]|uniref:Uncharacterized protein n=1 Tax=Mesocestoides corti TaxID=53468 RepID=A0A3P6H9J8_MESCO|nr:unnamed protein product [Mesocestoides corti]